MRLPNKKVVQIIIFSIIMAIFIYSSITLPNENNEEESIEKNNSIETTATPVSGKTVVIDAGHGSPDEGN